MAIRNFSGTLSVGKKRHWPSEATLADIRRPSRLHTVAEKGSSKSVRGRNKQYPAASMATTSIVKKHILFLAGFFAIFLRIFGKVT